MSGLSEETIRTILWWTSLKDMGIEKANSEASGFRGDRTEKF
jgi:hypothetical protein